DVCLDTRRVDDGGDREDEDGGEESLRAAGEHLRDSDQPDSAGGLHAVFDFAGETELLRQLHGYRLDALEHDGKPDDARNEDSGKRRLSPGEAGGSDALPDLRKHVEKHEAQEERLHQGANGELDEVLAQHHEVAQDERVERRPTRRRGGTSGRGRHASRRRGGDHGGQGLAGSGGSRHQSRRSFPVNPMKTVSSVGSATERSASANPSASAASTMRGTNRSAPLT